MVKCLIGDLCFKSKDSAQSYTRDIVRKGLRTITEEDEDWDFFCNLILNHTTKAKNKDLIKCFVVCKDLYNKPTGMYYRDIDNNKITFSWVDCARSSNKKHTDKTTALTAMREAVSYNILQKLNQSRECEFCGAIGKLEIDHYDMTFKNLTESYFNKFGIPKIERWQESLHQQIPVIFTEHRWINYHNKNTKLQALCSFCHKKKTKKERELE